MEITYVPDPSKADGKAVVGEIVTLGTTVVQFSGVQPVFVTGGTIQADISFTGSYDVDIGDVKLEDANGNYAVMPPASDAKTGATNALVVQAVDDTGTPLRQATQDAILNNQGTQATAANQAAGNSLLTVIMNNQGTQATAEAAEIAAFSVMMNNQGTLATSALQTAGNALLEVVMNNQGTQATSANQSASNSFLAVVMNNQGTQATSALQTAENSILSLAVNNQGTQATSALQTDANSLLTLATNNQGTQATSARQDTQSSILSLILNAQGTQGAGAGATQETTLVRVANDQGTQATSALQTIGNTALTGIYNAQGTIQRTAIYGTNGMPVHTAATTNGEYHLAVAMIQAVYASTKNNYSGNLTVGGVFYGTTETTLGVAAIQTMLKTDQNCIVNVDQSGNGGFNWDTSDAYNYYHAFGGASWTTQAVGDTYRIRIQNTGTATTNYFRSTVALCPVVEALPRALSANGNLKVDVKELESSFGVYGQPGRITPFGNLLTTGSVRLAGAAFTDTLDVNFWGSTATSTGTIILDGRASMQTGTGADGTVQVLSVRTARYSAASTNYFHASVLISAITGTNLRRWGAYTANDGCFFEHDGTRLALVCRKGGIDNRVPSGSFNGNLGTVVIPTNILYVFEIHWTQSCAWFLINGQIVHTFFGDTSPLMNTIHLPICAQNNNSGGNTANNLLDIRVMQISRYGPLENEKIYKLIGASGPAVLKYSPGRLHRINVLNPNSGASTIALYDNTFPSSITSMGTLVMPAVASQANPLPYTLEYACPFFIGLCVVPSTTSQLLVIYE